MGKVIGVVARLYVRPGCFYCGALRAQLRAAGLRVEEVDIWRDPSAAAFVRSHAGGDELVPTVAVGDRVLVNPSAPAVLAAAAAAGLVLVPPPPGAMTRAARVVRSWFDRREQP